MHWPVWIGIAAVIRPLRLLEPSRGKLPLEEATGHDHAEGVLWEQEADSLEAGVTTLGASVGGRRQNPNADREDARFASALLATRADVGVRVCLLRAVRDRVHQLLSFVGLWTGCIGAEVPNLKGEIGGRDQDGGSGASSVGNRGGGRLMPPK